MVEIGPHWSYHPDQPSIDFLTSILKVLVNTILKSMVWNLKISVSECMFPHHFWDIGGPKKCIIYEQL